MKEPSKMGAEKGKDVDECEGYSSCQGGPLESAHVRVIT